MADYEKLVPIIQKVWWNAKPHFVQLDSETGCFTSNYAKGTNKAYQQLRFEGRKYYMHIVAAVKHCGRAPSLNEEASHICHNPICVNPSHLVFEDGETNKTRGCCKKYGATQGYKCPHTPACLGCVVLSAE